jgi:hypothetical protein
MINDNGRRGIAAAAGMAALLGVTALATHGEDARALQSKAPAPASLAFANSADKQNAPGAPFKLSADYPREKPRDCEHCDWLAVPVAGNFKFNPDPKPSDADWTKGKWDQYIGAIFAYVREGQDPNLRDEIGFRTQVGGATRWYNVPWMAYDPTVGREWHHGTTNERTASIEDLVGEELPTAHRGAVHFFGKMSSACQAQFPNGFETWSVGYYNPQGGYALGRAIPRTGVPKVVDYMGSPMPDGLPFPQGTAVVKVLTTNATPECVPFLKNSPVWRVNRHVMDEAKNKAYSCDRKLQESRIVQIDVAVADKRSPTGWVYGTYAYDGNIDGATFWDRLVPLGVQWGADPWSFPAVPKSGDLPLQQSVANPRVKGDKLYEHMGCNGRLAGPVDNPQSSCMSCHASAYASKVGTIGTMGANIPPSFGFDGLCQAYSADNAAYFQNMTAPQSFPGGKFPNLMSLDTSLQLTVAFQQYGQYATAKAPVQCTLDSNQKGTR